MTSRAKRNIAPSKQPSPPGSNELTVILLAAKMGRRMKSKGPKSLFQLNSNLNIIDNQIQTIYMQYPNADVIVVVDFQYEKIRNYVKKRYPVRIVLSPDHEDYGMMHSVGVGLQASIGKNILVVYGDLVIGPNVFCSLSDKSVLHITEHTTKRIDKEIGATVIPEDSLIGNLGYGLPTKWCQTAYFINNEADILRNIAFSSKYYNWMFHEGINEVIKKGGEFTPYILSSSSVLDIDCWEDLEKAREMYE